VVQVGGAVTDLQNPVKVEVRLQVGGAVTGWRCGRAGGEKK
jgi:hypothetical protein